jgi:ABC-type Fe3+/spermidine/putrescine transport system ATPase subunit
LLVQVRLDGVTAAEAPYAPIDGVTLHVRHGELFTIAGGARSGKSMVLRAIAGLARVTGRIRFEDDDVAALPLARRGVGIVLQDLALWPHVSVRDHLGIGLARSGIADAEARRRIAAVLERLGLAGLEDRRPGDLTPERRCRLALARALVLEPRVLLLDEPLAGVEPGPRQALRAEIARLHGDLAVTTVHATRDPGDALALSNRIAVLVGGRVAQVGEPEDVYWRPGTRAVAEALGPINLIPVRVVEVRETGVVVESAAGARVPVTAPRTWRTGARGLLSMRPASLTLLDAAMGRGPGFPGKVVGRMFEGERYLYEVDVGAGMIVRTEVAAGDARVFRMGDVVRAELTTSAAVLLEPDE